MRTLFLVTLAGCSLQSYSEGIREICDAPVACPECLDGDASSVSLLADAGSRVTNRRARAVLEDLVQIGSEETMISVLQAHAREAGIETCPLATWMAQP